MIFNCSHLRDNQLPQTIVLILIPRRELMNHRQLIENPPPLYEFVVFDTENIGACHFDLIIGGWNPSEVPFVIQDIALP